MGTHTIIRQTFKVILPLLLGGAILYWMYRNFDFGSIRDVLLHEMNWTWMLLSFPFGILAQMFRGWRWKLALEPLGEHPRTSVSIYSIFLSYAVSLVIPRVGEFARCGVLKRYDNVSFPKAIGTVVTERAVDTLLMLGITALAFIMQVKVFGTFFSTTGTRFNDIIGKFTTAGWMVTAICGIAVLVLLYFVLRRLTIYNKVKEAVHSIWQGIMSVRKVKSVPLFAFYSVAIWVSYFLHYYLVGLSCHQRFHLRKQLLINLLLTHPYQYFLRKFYSEKVTFSLPAKINKIWRTECKTLQKIVTIHTP